MSFSRHTSRIYLDDLDVEGAINAFGHRIVDNPECEATPFYVGAHLILNLINNHSEIRDQSVLMQLFEKQLLENGISITAERN